VFSFKVEAFRANFFDSSSVINAVDKATRKALSKFGAFVRTSARSSIRRRKGVSKPGQPPYAHQGDIKRILFAYDPQSQGVVIGPIKFNGKVGQAPKTLEFGGSLTVKRVNKKGKETTKRVQVAARPFMNPALMKNLPQLPELWRNQVHR